MDMSVPASSPKTSLQMNKELRDKLLALRHRALDMYGTIYMENNIFPFTLDFLAKLTRMGITYSFYAENDGMAKGAVAALDEAGITHGVNGKVKVMGFDCNKWALRELLAGNWDYDGQCSPFQAAVIEQMIKTGNVPSKKVISEEKGFDAKALTQADIDKYGLGD